ncbi:L-lactate dehydrogenase [Geodermatophilus sp. TF02-6]|uniref:L-lactate dehydrogenase n=1 Tax=Geodermatophilus sp. TF02-6 TaxID=2250575 RepID=UPI000DE929E8|nr:L-lactate dehydrogenase [Geodermatophilus sp. TF02-6]RBY74887.1 L-lactate dehydrogenase [Geodermatophilus sp. TF02-6]
MTEPVGHPTKVAVVGAGAVGATLAYACLIRGVAHEVVLYDLDAAKVEAEVLDLRHGLQFVPRAQVTGGSEVSVCAGADVVVVTAGAKQKPGQTRLELAGTNTDIVRSLVPQLLEVAPDAVLVMVTNPVDVLTYAALRVCGLPSSRVLGSGTVLDSSRLRDLVAREVGVAVQSVHAFVVGEHGDSEVALWSSASVGSVPLDEFALPGRAPLDDAAKARIAREVVTAAGRIIEGKGATNYAIGLAGTRVVEAVVRGEDRVLPVTSLLTGTAGLADVCLSLPSVVGRGGVRAVLDVPLSAAERDALHRSADAVRDVARSLGI